VGNREVGIRELTISDVVDSTADTAVQQLCSRGYQLPPGSCIAQSHTAHNYSWYCSELTISFTVVIIDCCIFCDIIISDPTSYLSHDV